jgi:very-short-patch-repair endonuclease
MVHEERLSFRRQLRRNMTLPERLLWGQLRGKKLAGLKFRRQHPVGPYVVDFFCAERQLAIELDGEPHFDGDGPARDRRRDAFLQTERIRVLRFTNPDVLRDLDGVLDAIADQATWNARI